ncbi:MAG: 2-oxoacid:acceptor oxidoreductase family protein [Verrucomicrobiae bacterium]|nr:2-oxoacid:acceptor oxidoreductase family protein [Verrucomicrobiae bacterium]
MSKSLAAAVDPRFLKEEGSEVFTGNELIVKGLLETEGGSHLWTGYPGSPVAGFFDTIERIAEIPKRYGIRAVLAHNEALSVAMLNGSQMLGLRAIAVMKSVGVHVASDALALGNLGGAHPEGGAIVVMGDDPWSDSTQVPADSRYLAKHLHMPVLEPTDNQEIKDWIDIGFRLSREAELYIGYLITTNQADGGGSVRVRRNNLPRINTNNPIELDTSKVDFENKVLLPPRTWRKEQDFPSRYRRLWASAEKYGVDRLALPSGTAPGKKYRYAFVSSALAFAYLGHALAEMGLTDAFPILKLGVTYPINPAQVRRVAEIAEEIIVIEERRGFIEEQVAAIANHDDLRIKVWGKDLPGDLRGIPAHRGLNPSILIECLGPVLLNLRDPLVRVDAGAVEAEMALIAETANARVKLAARTPTFCPGCPHRDSASLLVDIKRSFRDPAYMARRHRRGPVDIVFHGDTGCYTMLMFEPTKDLMHNYSGMGLGGGTGLGIDAFITNKQVVFMGDSTFFHSGQLAISNSIKNGQDITYIILDNRTTAMTGHQITPGLDRDILGNETFTQNIDRIASAITRDGGAEITRTNPADRDHYRRILENTILRDGVKVIIADKECGITFHRARAREERAEVRKRGFLRRKRFVNVAADVCEHCLECTIATGCPGLTFVETDFGRKLQTDLSWCVADTACTKTYACPSFEEITIVRHQKPSPRLERLDIDSIPLPAPRAFEDAFRVYLAGVGGMGVASSTATLVRAGHREGFEVKFCDKAGLAIRNGGIYSHITYLKPGKDHSSSIIPYGKADLILGIDALEAARGLDPATNQRVGSRTRTAAVVNTSKTPTILTLLGKDDFCVADLEDAIRHHTLEGRYFGHNVSELSERFFGTKLYGNILMLGIAFQRGELPLSIESLEWAIRETMGPAATDNWKAFNLGRWVAARGPAEKAAPAPTYNDVVAEKSSFLRKRGRRGERQARQLFQLVTRAVEPLRIDQESLRLFAIRIHDLLQYDGPAYAQRYVDSVLSVYRRDSAQHGFAATRAVVWNAHRVMAIKDEVWVAHLLTSDEKYARDQERYGIDPERGDHIIYHHLNRPEFTIGSRTFRFKIRSRDWMLRLMRECRFLRRWLPAWHAKERQFRDWYLKLADEFRFSRDEDYQVWTRSLRLPESVTGYREIRYPKMDAARQRAAEWLRETAASSSKAL